MVAPAILVTLFELSPAGTGPWTYKVIHDFTSAEGGGLNTQLVLDSSGNLYGGLYTIDGTYSGIFELGPGPDGAWTESNLHTFDGATDGAQPSGPLVFDPAGNLYGSNSAGGQYGAGTAFELTPIAGDWNFSVIHAFGQSYLTDGYYPEGGVILDGAQRPIPFHHCPSRGFHTPRSRQGRSRTRINIRIKAYIRFQPARGDEFTADS